MTKALECTSGAQLVRHFADLRANKLSCLHCAGQVVALDSSFTWETGLQTYVVGVQQLQAAGARPPPPPYVRHLYCDLAVRYGFTEEQPRHT